MEKITVRHALRRGFWIVSVPILAIMFPPWLACYIFASNSRRLIASVLSAEPAIQLVLDTLLIISVISIPLAWLYWSLAIPKWKLWAYSRVENVHELKVGALEENLIWPDGHIFEKTELCSKETRAAILQLEGRL